MCEKLSNIAIELILNKKSFLKISYLFRYKQFNQFDLQSHCYFEWFLIKIDT
jgi:hypothetical protein